MDSGIHASLVELSLSSEKVQSSSGVAIDSGIHADPAELSLSSEKVQSSSRVQWFPGSKLTQQSCLSVLRKFS